VYSPKVVIEAAFQLRRGGHGDQLTGVLEPNPIDELAKDGSRQLARRSDEPGAHEDAYQ
jgi:hypothetical protein